MNEPLNPKLWSLYGRLLNKELLREAWKRVRANKGTAGIDRIFIKDFEANLDNYLEEIFTELKNKTYKPTPVKRTYIPKKNGKMRPLGIPTVKDRVVQMALVMVLEPTFEKKVFHDNSCGFRPNRGAETVLRKIICRIEWGYTYIYDFDIKGFFDHISHKKLMKILNKYIADGSVLDLIWKMLKAGYIEDDKAYPQKEGSVQGGVISPLLANIYLNELDWELDKAGIQAVRYADDSICMCRSQEELDRAKEVVNRVMNDLKLELAEDKTKEVDFQKDDFDFLGFTFYHLRISAKGKLYYTVEPSQKSLKKFRDDLKEVTNKKCTFSYEEWASRLNPILRGKYNYFLNANRACMAVAAACREANRVFHGIAFKRFDKLDGYVRERIRTALSNRGRKHGNRMQAKLLRVKYGVDFFVRDMGLVSGEFLRLSAIGLMANTDDYLALLVRKKARHRRPYSASRANYYKFAYAK